MSDIYSTRVIDVHAGASAHYTVPAGNVLVVRCITAFNPNAVLPEKAGLVNQTTGSTIWQVGNLGGASLGVGDSVTVDMRSVVNAGETLATNNDSDIDMTVSGYLLTAP